jgi:hypothetical protein
MLSAASYLSCTNWCRCTTLVRSFVINIELTPAEDQFDRTAFRSSC